jgi:hypothetical protein
MASPLEAHLILCDAAVADSATGKVHMLGAGWSTIMSPTPPHAVAVLMKVPWDRANIRLPLRLELFGPDGNSIQIKTPDGGVPILGQGAVEVGRPPGIAHGSALDASFVLNIGPLPLSPGRYEWRLTLAELELPAPFTVLATAA